MQSLRAVTRRHAIQSVRSLCLRCPSVCHIHPSPSPTSTCTSSLLVSHRISSLTSTSFPSHRSRGFATLGGVTVTDLGMPALSPTMEKGNVAKWKIAVGDRIKPGEVICSIETDKATVDFEAQEEGYLAAIFLGDGTQDVPVGKAIGVMVDDKEDVAKVQAALKSQPASTSTSTPAAKPTLAASTPAPKPASKPAPAPPASAPSPATPSKSTTSTSTPAPTSTSTSTSSSSIQHPPSVLHLLHNHHLDPSSITATGKNGRLTKGDVLMAIAKGTAKKAADKPATATATATTTSASTPSSSEPAPRLRGNRTHIDIPSTQMRKVIASRLAQSKSTIPHAYASTDVVMDQLLKLRSSLKASGTTVPSVNDFIIRASALALRDHPSVARYWDPKTNDIKDSSSIDISVAVATDTGLITPIVKKADTKRIGEISTIVKDLAQRARQNKLKPDEFMGGAFTISNLGMFGIDQFAAVINPPQSCILAVGGSKSIVRPVSHPTPTPTTDGSASLQLETVSIMSVTLSCDGRVVDAEQAGIWLTSFRNYLENPTTMLQ